MIMLWMPVIEGVVGDAGRKKKKKIKEGKREREIQDGKGKKPVCKPKSFNYSGNTRERQYT